MYPVKSLPIVKSSLWGGTKILKYFNLINYNTNIAELWLLVLNDIEENMICDLSANLSFHNYLNKESSYNILGKRIERLGRFPFLIKFLCTEKDMSIQVHPDDIYAYKNGMVSGKEELWYILDCDRGAYIYYGLTTALSKQKLCFYSQNGTITRYLNKIPIKPGDVFVIPPGTIHSMSKGVIAYELQENSNQTFRLYDYDRNRNLNIQEAAEVAILEPVDTIYMQVKDKPDIIVKTDKFVFRKISIIKQKCILISEDSFHSIVCVKGKCIIKVDNMSFHIEAGDSWFMPAQKNIYTIIGCCEMLLAYLA